MWNIIRFNWHFYALAGGFLLILVVLINFFNQPIKFYGVLLFVLIICLTFTSLLTSFYIYDLSGLYKLDWLNGLQHKNGQIMLNIHAGFDETSALLQRKFPAAELKVFDFYDPDKHTEVSIRRARKAYPPFPNTQTIRTHHLPLPTHSVNCIFLILAAHEIRDPSERTAFFNELKRILKPTGEIVVTEHLRDTANFLAYNLGFFHFHSKKTWLQTFRSAQLRVKQEVKINPFITTFVLSYQPLTGA